jgi:hypothetical protein
MDLAAATQERRMDLAAATQEGASPDVHQEVHKEACQEDTGHGAWGRAAAAASRVSMERRGRRGGGAAGRPTLSLAGAGASGGKRTSRAMETSANRQGGGSSQGALAHKSIWPGL